MAMRTILALHLLAAGVWLGCILVEVAFERALARGESYRVLLAELHRKVDLWVETPVFLLVLATGTALLSQVAAPGALLMAKVAIGVIAVVANVYCVWLVLERRRLALAGDAEGYRAVDEKQHRWGAVVLLGVVLALVLGLVIASRVA